MKNKKQAYTIFLIIIASVLMLGSCRKEKIKPEQADTFIKYYGKGGTQKAGNVAITTDGGYILVGTTDSYGNGKDILVVKTDQYGNEKWSKVLGGAGDDEGNYVIVSSNGNYILVGSKAEAGGSTSDVYVAELNAAGSIVGENTYGTAGKNDSGARIINAINGGYAIVGTSSDHSIALSAVYLIKLNNNRDTLWTSKYGSNPIKYTGTSIRQYPDTAVYITSAYTSTSDMLITTGRLQTNPDLFYNPKSNMGNQYADPSVVDATDILVGASGNKYILGNTLNGNIYISNNAESNTNIYYKAFTTLPQSKSASFSKTSDGGFVIIGSTMSGGTWDILVIRTDVNANIIWSKTFGGAGNDYGASVEQKLDGSYIVAGTIAFGGNGIGSNDVMSLIHIDANGELK